LSVHIYKMASYSGQSSSKPKSKVKPILRKLTQSEKNSLDLNRPAVEQGLGMYTSESGTGSRSAHDVTFQSTRRGYHNRSTSGTSQFSTNTTGSGHRSGSFVHPWQQTPRPYTPPIAPSFSGSLMGSEYSRDSPVFPEDEDEPHYRPPQTLRNGSSLSNVPASQNTIQPALRIQTTPSTSYPRVAFSSSQTNIPSSLAEFSQDIISPADTMTPSSTLRSSFDRGYRLRSHSNTDPSKRAESIREARRKFQEKELAKEERAHLAEVKALEKQNLKEARQIEKDQRKASSDGAGRAQRSRSRSDLVNNQEKVEGFMSRDYNSAPVLDPPAVNEESYSPPRRSRTAKRKTHSAWTQFMMWLRTRFLRMGKSR
jgi:hypothetical protein